MAKNTRTKNNRGTSKNGAGAKADAQREIGPLEMETCRLAESESRIYRDAMSAAYVRRIDRLESPPARIAVGGFAGLAAFRDNMRHEEHDDDVVSDSGKPSLEVVTAQSIAARLVLARQIDARVGLGAAIRTGSPVVVVDVPDPTMFDSVGRVWEEVLLPDNATSLKLEIGCSLRYGRYDALHIVAGNPMKPKDADAARIWALKAFGLALPIIAFSPRAETHLPAELLLACTHRIAIPPLDAHVIVRTIEIVTGRRCTARLDDECVARTGLTEIAIAVRFDRMPAECVAGLRRLADAKAVKRGSRDLRLDELHGMDEAVAWARGAIADIESWKRKEIPWSAASRSVALNGPAGTGKTTFAHVFASEANLPIVSASLAGWQSSGEGHLGHCLRAMRADMEKARTLAKPCCVVFIDELDSFPNRSTLKHSHADYQIEIVNGFLELLDGLGDKEGLIFIAASNDITRCDPALIRAGRLNPVIEIGLPGLTDLERMFRVRLGDDLVGADLVDICERTLGGAGADVERIVADARRRARHDGGRPISTEDLIAVVQGRDDRPEGLKRRAAVHEAGHIVIDVLFNGPDGIHATISPARGIGGRVVRVGATGAAGTYDEYSRRLQILLAGRTAEILLCGNCSHGSGGVEGSDLATSAAMAAAMAGSLGLAGPRPLLFLARRENTAELLCYPEVRIAANEELVKAEEACLTLLRRHLCALKEVSELLLAQGRIDGSTVAALLERAASAGGSSTWSAATRTSDADGALPGSGEGHDNPRIRNIAVEPDYCPLSSGRDVVTGIRKPR